MAGCCDSQASRCFCAATQELCKPEEAGGEKRRKSEVNMQKAFGKKSIIFLFVFPAFLIYTLFVIVSIVWAGYYSFFDWSGVGEKAFIGLKNYVDLLAGDDIFRSTVWHTIVYTIINVLIQVFGGLLFAILLSRVKKGRVTLQTLYYVPVVISSVAICQIL